MMANISEKKIWAIVPAAGSGQRMASAMPKQYLKINATTMLELSLQVLLQEARVNHVVVCIAEDDEIWNSLTISQHEKICRALGGSSRAQSVVNGLRSISGLAAADDWIMVHDAARPCLSPQLLAGMIQQLMKNPVGGILAVPAKDTLKIVSNQDHFVERTLDRSSVWHAQTPQMFRYSLLRDALERALKSNAKITDEASAMEMAGYQVKLVLGDANNIKVTTDDDLQLVKLMFRD